jgi:hypothetical protein
MPAIESAYVDARTFLPTAAGMLPADLEAVEPSIHFLVLATANTAPTATTASNTVNYTGTATTYAVGSKSESTKTFGVSVNKAAGGGNKFWVDGAEKAW